MQTCKFLVLEITLFNEAHVSLLVLGEKILVIKATWIGLKSTQFDIYMHLLSKYIFANILIIIF